MNPCSPIMAVTGFYSYPICASGSYVQPETEEEKARRILKEKLAMKEKLAKFKKFSLTSEQEPPILNK